MIELKEIVLSVLADYIADQVVARLNAEKKKAVILFTGSLAGADDMPEMLASLVSQGWELKAVLSREAETLLPTEELRHILPSGSIFTEPEIRQLRQLIDQRPFLLIPALTVNMAAKIACCIADDPISNAVAYGIGRGKQILACVDGCCPDRKALLPGGYHAPEPYREQMRSNMTTLARYGIWLTNIRSLPDEAERQFTKLIRSGSPSWRDPTATASAVPQRRIWQESGAAAELQSAQTAAITDLRGLRVVGKGDVLSCGQGGSLLVNREAVITQVAADEIKRQSIELVKG